jgi:hypothetical protein
LVCEYQLWKDEGGLVRKERIKAIKFHKIFFVCEYQLWKDEGGLVRKERIKAIKFHKIFFCL